MKSIFILTLSLSFSFTLSAQKTFDYETDIAPVLEKYCVKCHGPEKQKSGYRLDSYEALMTPGDSEEVAIDAGFPMTSPLIEYLLLPPEDEYAMPPEGEDAPSGDEILTIARWIHGGAKSESAGQGKLSLENLLDESAFSAVERLRTKGAVIDKLAENSSNLVVDLQSLAPKIDSSDVEDLKSVGPYVHEFRAALLSGSAKVSEWIGAFENATRLDLSHGKFGDEIVASLNRLDGIKYLNLFGTQLTDSGLKDLQVPKAGQLFLGNTKVRNAALMRARADKPNVTIYGNPDVNKTLGITEKAWGNSSTFNPIPEVTPGRQVSDHGIRHSFLICGKLTAIFNEESEVVWLGPSGSRDGMVLENGNVLLSVKNEAREFEKGGHKAVWSYKLDPRNKELGTVNRLPSGNTLVIERGELPRLLEIDPQGKIVVEVPLQPETDNGHMQTRMARKLSNGNYLVPHLLAFKVKEYTPSGEIVNTIKTDLPELGGREAENWPFTAIRLPNGNTLVNLTHGNQSVEFAPDGSVAWVCNNDDAGGRFADPCGGQRLPNGNTVIGSYGQKDPEKVKIFEVNEKKEVVWEFFRPDAKAHQIHILTTNGKPVSPIYR
ncbi:hypothetical protein N8787_03475 [Opitutaceae bacterium]|nr:hypothetical protein [Opitutaceae bacterium]